MIFSISENRKKLKDFFSYISLECITVCIYLICMPFTIVKTPFGSLLKVITIPIMAYHAYKLVFGKSKLLRFNGVHFTYSLYMLYTITGLFMLHNELAVTATEDMLMAYATTLLITMKVYNYKERDLIDFAWILAGIFCIYLGIFCSEPISAAETRVVIKIYGSAEDPNQFCAYFFIPIMVAVKRVINKSKFTPLYIVYILLILYTILLGGSRGGLLGVMVGIVIYVLMGVKSIQKKITMIVVGALCSLIVVGVVFPLLPTDVRERYSVDRVVEDKGTGRIDIWVYLIQYTSEKPERIIRGSGVLSTSGILANATVNEAARVAHNQYVQVFTDQGLIGILFYLIWLATCFFRTIKKNPDYSAAFIACMALSASLTLYTFKPLTNVILMCALTCSSTCYEEEVEDKIIKNV